MDQVSAFQVYNTMKKLKPSKQKKVKRLKKKEDQLLNNMKNVKEKIQNALQDLELVETKEAVSKTRKNKNKKNVKGTKMAKLEMSYSTSIDSETEVKKLSQSVANSSIRLNCNRSSVHEKMNRSLKVTETSNPGNLKKGNKPMSKLTEPREKKENRLNKGEKKKRENSMEENERSKSVLAIAAECPSSSSDSNDDTIIVKETNKKTPNLLNYLTETLSDSMDSDDLDFDDMSEVEDNYDHSNPLDDSKAALDFLLYPVTSDMFFRKYWEKTPILIKGKPKKFFSKGKPLVNTPMIDDILRNHHIQFTKNIDITTYTNGIRETHNPEGRAYPSVVWDYYLNDCSIRMLNPQTYIPSLHLLNSTLQEFFGCFVGANLYLTPPNSQGFAPHYDDIEAFILQVEGQKRWRLYKPRSQSEVMPRYSSKNFTDAEIGKPFMDVVLKQGDLLYFPRGTIHQGETVDGKHSLHVTLSVYQRNSWADFMEKLVPQALNSAIDDNAKFRTGMPLGYLKHIGVAYENKESTMRDTVMSVAKNLMEKMIKYLDVDKAADEMAKNHVHDFLPVSLQLDESECSIMEDGERMMEDGKTSGMVEIEPDTEIRLLRHHCARLIKDGEDNTYKLFYSTENSKVYHEYELQYLEIGEEYVSGMKKIINEFPNFVRVEDLPIDGLDKKIQLAKDLWEKCLVITRHPLPTSAE